MNKNKRGFNLIELAIVLAIVGGVVAGIYIGVSAAIDRHRVNRTVEQVEQIMNGMRNLYATHSMGMSCDNWGECSLIEVAIKTNIMPSDMINTWQVGNNTGTDYYNAHNMWGGGFYVSYGRYWVTPTSNINTIFVNFDPISAGACPRLAMALIINQPDVVYYSIDNGPGVVPPPYGQGNTLTPELASTLCGNLTNNHMQVLYKV